MKLGRQYIHCGSCGARIEMRKAMQNRIANSQVCSENCWDQLNNKYYEYVMGKDAPIEGSHNASSETTSEQRPGTPVP